MRSAGLASALLGFLHSILLAANNVNCPGAMIALSADLEPKRFYFDGPGQNYGAYDFTRLFAKLGIKQGDTYFEKKILERRRVGLSSNVMDLFGSGFFVSENIVDSMTGVRLEPLELRPSEIEANLSVPPAVYGDLTKSDTWVVIDQSLRSRMVPSLDLVVMRPKGGWLGIGHTGEANAEALTFIAREVSKRLSPSGEFYFEVSHASSTLLLENYETFQKLIAELETRTPPFEVVLVSSKNGESVHTTSGLIRPKKTP